MRQLLILSCLAAKALALTTIAESHITAPDGTLASGYILVTAVPSFTAADGSRVETQTRINVVNGQFIIGLEPTDTAQAVTPLYQVAWHLNNSAPRTEYWTIPTTVDVLGVANVQTAASINSLGTVSWAACIPMGNSLIWTGIFGAFDWSQIAGGRTWNQL